MRTSIAAVLLFCSFLSFSISHAHELPVMTPNRLTFSFDSPIYPWSAEELNTLSAALRDFYPVAESVYGEPAFNITVNVRKDPTISFSGEYSPTVKEIVLRDAANLDVLCHEMIHAFRDDNMIRINNYEEGMTIAAEVEVFNRLAAYTFWNENHSYLYDVYYEGLNKQAIGSQFGNFNYASPFLLLRYHLCGYAWAKVLLENQNFLVDFNKKLYAQTLVDPQTISDESRLLGIAVSLQSSVEGEPFLTWYARQGILTTTPQAGYFLYQNISNFNIYYFHRDALGFEVMQPNETIQWAVYDYLDGLMDSGSDATSLLGWISMHPVLPADYKGRIKIVAAASSPEGIISNIALRSIGDDAGIFGITADTDFGTISFTPLDYPASSVNVDVMKGAFSSPSLTEVKGRFIAIYADNEGQFFSKRFNKDASDYFLPMIKSAATADLSVSHTSFPDPVAVGSNLTSTVTITNNGPDTAAEVVLTDTLPNGAIFVSAVPAQGSCVLSSSIICSLDTIPPGASTTVDIILTSSVPGSLKNMIRVAGNVDDPDMANNSVVATSTVVDTVPPLIGDIVGLINEIDSLVELGALNQGRGNSLISIIESAKMQAERGGKTITIANQLQAFIDHVNAFVRVGILSEQQGKRLVDTAEDIILKATVSAKSGPTPGQTLFSH